MEFNYDDKVITELTVHSLLKWISQLHGELADNGTWTALSTQTHNELMLLAEIAEGQTL